MAELESISIFIFFCTHAETEKEKHDGGKKRE